MADFDARMAALRERFVAQTAREARAMAEHVQAQRWDAVRDLCHGLAGRAGMFGFAALGEVAREVEEAVDAGRSPVRLRTLIDRLLAEVPRIEAP